MNKPATFLAAIALSFAAFGAQAAPQATVRFERVVITGTAVRNVAQLPRVVVNGLSEATLLRNATLAAAKPSTKRA